MAVMYGRLFVLSLLLVGAGCSSAVGAPSQSAEADVQNNQTQSWLEKRMASSSEYVVYSATGNDVIWTLTRPSKEDDAIWLAVPATYTSPTDAVEGYVVLDGQVVQDKERQGWNGAVLFSDGGVEIVETHNGRALTKTLLGDVAKRGASLMQAHLLVIAGRAEHFKEQPLFRRRALALFEDGAIAVIESQEPLDLNNFADDLVLLGVRSAVNLDMGSWSEGWYRDVKSGRAVTIGFPTDSTKRQSNWIVFRQN